MLKKTTMLLKKRTHNRFIDGFKTPFNLAQGKYQNLLGKTINRRAVTISH
jgi:HAE1 family hydrophobic/amphiphilic exporter-1